MIRLFAALALPAKLTERLDAMAGGIPDARWVAARNVHVTLRFFGETDEAAAQDLHHALGEIQAEPFTLTLNGFGTFGGAKPRALWAGIAAEPALNRLQRACESAARLVDLPPETRKFTPHITLAWLRNSSPDRIAAFMAAHSPFHAGPIEIGEFHLFRSTLGQGGAEYQSLVQYPLESK